MGCHLQCPKILLCVFLRQSQDSAPRLHYHFLAAPFLSLYPLPSQIGNCFNLLFGTSRKATLKAVEKPHSQESYCPSSSAVGGLRGLHPTHILSQLVRLTVTEQSPLRQKKVSLHNLRLGAWLRRQWLKHCHGTSDNPVALRSP